MQDVYLFASILQVLGFSKRTINTYYLNVTLTGLLSSLTFLHSAFFYIFISTTPTGYTRTHFFGEGGNQIEMKLDRSVTL